MSCKVAYLLVLGIKIKTSLWGSTSELLWNIQSHLLAVRSVSFYSPLALSSFPQLYMQGLLLYPLFRVLCSNFLHPNPRPPWHVEFLPLNISLRGSFIMLSSIESFFPFLSIPSYLLLPQHPSTNTSPTHTSPTSQWISKGETQRVIAF